MTTLEDLTAVTGDAAAASPSRPLPLRALAARAARAVRSAPWLLCLVVAAGATLRFAELDDVPANHFYDAAVRSMTLSWHNFFVGAFDPAGFLSVDKTPLDLWLQVASVKLLGWNATALKLPEALAGTLAVPLLYDAVRRVAGAPAGLCAAAALALLPSSVLTARSDTMDATMMLLVIAALWLLIRGAQTGRRRPTVLAGVMLGLAFNVKLFEALVGAPGLFLFALLAASTPVRRRLLDLGLAAAALVAVGLSWALPASLAPGRHAWPIGSTDGTVWNVMFVFNGFGRVTPGQDHVTVGGPGPFRLLQGNTWHYNTLFGCVLVAGVSLGLAALLAATVHRRRAGTAPEPLSAPRALAIAAAVWLALGYALFSHAPVVHTRYLDAVVPALAIIIGLSVASLTGLGAPRSGAPARPAAVALALGLAGGCAYLFTLRPTTWGIAAAAVSAAAVGAALLGRSTGRTGQGARWLTLVLAMAAATLFPVHSALRVIQRHASNSLGLATYPDSYEANLSSYLTPRTAGIRYEVIADEPLALAPLIVRDQRPIVPLTSFKGIRAVRLPELQRIVAAGEARYALISAYPCTGPADRNAACVPAARWIKRYGVDVSANAGIVGGHRLYLLLPR